MKWRHLVLYTKATPVPPATEVLRLRLFPAASTRVSLMDIEAEDMIDHLRFMPTGLSIGTCHCIV